MSLLTAIFKLSISQFFTFATLIYFLTIHRRLFISSTKGLNMLHCNSFGDLASNHLIFTGRQREGKVLKHFMLKD